MITSVLATSEKSFENFDPPQFSHKDAAFAPIDSSVQRSPILPFGNPWFRDAVQKLVRISRYDDNWDTYSGHRISERAKYVSLSFLQVFAEKRLPIIAVVPTSAGGVQFEWASARADIEVAIGPDGSLQLFRAIHGGAEVYEDLNPGDPSWLQKAIAFVSH